MPGPHEAAGLVLVLTNMKNGASPMGRAVPVLPTKGAGRRREGCAAVTGELIAIGEVGDVGCRLALLYKPDALSLCESASPRAGNTAVLQGCWLW